MTRDCFINYGRPNDKNIANTRAKFMPLRQAILFKAAPYDENFQFCQFFKFDLYEAI